MNIGSLFFVSFGIGGRSSDNGFEIRLKGRKYSTKKYNQAKKTQENPEETSEKSPFWLSWVVTATLMLAVGTVYFFVPGLRPVITWMMEFPEYLFKIITWPMAFFSAVLLMLLLYLFFVFLPKNPSYLSRNSRQYHACEHMSIALISARLPATFENLRKMPRVGLSCGGTVVIFLAIWPIYRAVESLFFKEPSSGGMICAVAILLAILLSSYCLQYYLTTAKPSNRKLKEALKLVKEVRAGNQ